MNTKPQQTQAQQDTRRALMEAAIAAIWRNSYATVGVAEICKQAGVTKGGFYHHFASKADLFYEASQYYWEGFKRDLDGIFSPSHTPLQQLEKLIAHIIAKQEHSVSEEDANPVSGCPFFTSGAQVGTGEKRVRDAAQEMSDKAIRYNLAMIRGLQAEGLIASEHDAEQLARQLYQYVMGLLLYGRVMHSLEIVKQDIASGILRLLAIHPQDWPPGLCQKH
jgi:TetR/AcrR family transcriptional repressor of nem operon